MNGASREHHPEPSKLERFMRGELSRGEARSVIRHLLADCPPCVAITRQFWSLGGLRGLEGLLWEMVEWVQE